LLALAAATPAAAQNARRIITGTVTDTAGAPIANAEVYVSGDSANTRTNAGGRFRLMARNKGSADIVARHLGFAPATLGTTIPDSGTVTLNFQLVHQAQSLADIRVVGHDHGLSGIVVNEDGTPVPGAQVQLLGRGEHQTTEANGKFARRS
jgi:protocatechuate 3,4-dioxygenase beta subunit